MFKKIMNWLNKTKGQEEFEKFQKEIQTPEISREELKTLIIKSKLNEKYGNPMRYNNNYCDKIKNII